MKIDVPDEPDEAAIADGILKLSKDWKGGPKAAYLGQVVSLVPPSLWELTWDREPVDILHQMRNSNWGETLMMALAKAAVGFEDVTWCELLIRTWFEDEASPLWNEDIGSELMELADMDTVQAIALDFLPSNGGLPEEESPVFQLFILNDAQWSDELARQILQRFKAWMKFTQQPDWTSFHYNTLLKMLAYRCPINFYEQLKSGWDKRVPMWSFWEQNINEMVETVFFRRSMILELEQ